MSDIVHLIFCMITNMRGIRRYKSLVAISQPYEANGEIGETSFDFGEIAHESVDHYVTEWIEIEVPVPNREQPALTT